MRYFINFKIGGLTCTTSLKEAEKLVIVGFTEVSIEVYKAEYWEAWNGIKS